MKRLTQFAKSLAIFALFAASTMVVGCNAADLAGPEAPQTESGCKNDCSNGRNL